MYNFSVCFAWAFSEERCYTANLSVTFGDSSFVQRCYTTKPLSHCFAMPAPLSRGATGVPVLVLLDELSFSEPKTEVLRCLGAQHLYEISLVERSLDAVCLDSGALFFAQDKTFIVQQGLPDLPMAPLLGELSAKQTERFVTEQHSSVEHSPAVASNEDKARLLKSRKATTRRSARPANGSPFGRAGALAPERVCSGTALFGGAQSSSRCQ